MLLYPGQYIGDIEDVSTGGANRMAERLKGDGAKIKRQTSEWRSIVRIGFRYAGTCACRIRIFGGPLTVCNLEKL